MATAPGLSHLEFYKLQWFMESPGDHRLPFHSKYRTRIRRPFEQIRWASFIVKCFYCVNRFFLSPNRSFVFAHVKNKVRGHIRAPSSYLAPFSRHPFDRAGSWVTTLCLFWFSVWVTTFWLKYLLCIEHLARKVSMSRSHSTVDRTLHWV